MNSYYQEIRHSSIITHLRFPVITRIAIILFALMVMLPNGSGDMSPSVASANMSLSGRSPDIIRVKFLAGTDVNPPEDALPTNLTDQVDSIRRHFSLSDAELDDIITTGENLSGQILPDLKLWFEITLKPSTDAIQFIADLRNLTNVESAHFAPLPAPLPAVTPVFTANQSYLDSATDGIDARFSWTIPGGNGSGITIYELEYNWLQTHEDLSKVNGVTLLLAPGDSNNPPGYPGCPAPCDSINREHGTAVLGELIADDDTKGVTGISWGANIGLVPTRTTNEGFDIADAIARAVKDGSPGDVILIEQQLDNVCGLADGNLGPVENDDDIFQAIQIAVANRFVVVEAAGNGGVDLDQPACGTTFDRSVRDSGAIIVGAGQPPNANDRERSIFAGSQSSSYGSRVDVQGWGQGVVTTGYGDSYVDPDDPTNPNFFYTDTFSGTSSASPIVAGAVANIQGIALQRFGTPLVPFQVRQLLVDTGSPQQGNLAEHIGPRPDLREAIRTLTEGAIDLYFLVDLSGSFADDLPVFKAQAPGIINTIRASNPNTRFGLGSYEDYPIPPFGDAPSGDVAYRRNIDLTFDTDAVLDVIDGLFTRFGGDTPQSQLPALFQAASGAGQDLSGSGFPVASIPPGQQANFRDGSTKLFLLWTDADFHLPGDPGSIPYPGPSFVETVDAILALDPPRVIGVSSGAGGIPDLEAIAEATGALAPPGGVDCDGDGINEIAPGEPLVCATPPTGQGIGEAIEALVTAGAAVTIAKQVDQSTVAPGTKVTYTISVSNMSGTDAQGVSITDTLPAGFSYEPGSTSGSTTSEPSIVGQQLTWQGPFVIPDGATFTLSFMANASSIPGTYLNNAVAVGTNLPVTSTGDVAPVEVTVPSNCPDDVLISSFRTTPSNQQFVDITSMGGSTINLDNCSLVAYNVFTELSIGNATVALSGSLAPGETIRMGSAGAGDVDVVIPDGALPAGPGGLAILDAPPPPDGTPFSEVQPDDITGMVYLDTNTVFGVSHLRVQAHNAVYECIYGGSGQGPFMGPFTPVGECLGAQ